MNDETYLKKLLRRLFVSQRLAVLGSNKEGYPYLNLVAFAATEDLKHLFFCTTKPTRKYTNLKTDGRASLLIDSRSNDESDFHEAVAVSAVGHVRDLFPEERDEFHSAYLSKHPYLEDFVKSPSCAHFIFDVASYYLVRTFQNVSELHMKR
jgi:hypothetical protein